MMYSDPSCCLLLSPSSTFGVSELFVKMIESTVGKDRHSKPDDRYTTHLQMRSNCNLHFELVVQACLLCIS